MATKLSSFQIKPTNPIRQDPPGAVKTMPSPREMHHAHIDTKEYKSVYQFTEAFGETPEADFDPEKMVALYESGVSDTILLDREEVRRMRREGTL
jgi:hypothetical protein